MKLKHVILCLLVILLSEQCSTQQQEAVAVEDYQYHFVVVPLFIKADLADGDYINWEVEIEAGKNDTNVAMACKGAQVTVNSFCYVDVNKPPETLMAGTLMNVNFTIVDGLDQTGHHTSGILLIRADKKVTVRVTSRLADQCASFYTVHYGYTSTSYVVPFLDDYSFIAIISFDEDRTVVTMRLSLNHTGIYQEEYIANKLNANPFDPTGLAIVEMEPYDTYLLVIRDFPELKKKGKWPQGVYIRSSNAVKVMTGISDRDSDSTGDCYHGHTIKEVQKVRRNARYYIVPDVVGADRQSRMFVTMRHPGTDLEVRTKTPDGGTTHKLLFYQDRGDTYSKMLGDGDILKVIGTKAMTVSMIVRRTTGPTADVGLMQFVPVDQFVERIKILKSNNKNELKQTVYLTSRRDYGKRVDGVIGGHDVRGPWTGLKYKDTIKYTYRVPRYEVNKTHPASVIEMTDEAHRFMGFVVIETAGGQMDLMRAEFEYSDEKCTKNDNIEIDDGIDNDCDGMIDEEIGGADNKDTDGDNVIDEDTSSEKTLNKPVCGTWSEWQCSVECEAVGEAVRQRNCVGKSSVLLGRRYINYLAKAEKSGGYEECDKREESCIPTCPSNFWNETYCDRKCPTNCFQGRCNISNGICVSCVPGYMGEACDQSCPADMFGYDCLKNCSTFCKTPLCDDLYGVCEATTCFRWAILAGVVWIVLVFPTFCLLIHAIFLFGRNKTRVWKFGDPLREIEMEEKRKLMEHLRRLVEIEDDAKKGSLKLKYM